MKLGFAHCDQHEWSIPMMSFCCQLKFDPKSMDTIILVEKGFQLWHKNIPQTIRCGVATTPVATTYSGALLFCFK